MMATNPVTAARTAFTWLVLFGCVIAAAFNLWLAINGSWPGWIAAAMLALMAGLCFRSLWRKPEKKR